MDALRWSGAGAVALWRCPAKGRDDGEPSSCLLMPAGRREATIFTEVINRKGRFQLGAGKTFYL